MFFWPSVMLLYRIKICCSSLGPTLRYPPFFHHPRVKIAWFFAWEPPFQTWTSPISHGMSLSYVCSIHQLKHVETTFESCPKKTLRNDTTLPLWWRHWWTPRYLVVGPEKTVGWVSWLVSAFFQHSVPVISTNVLFHVPICSPNFPLFPMVSACFTIRCSPFFDHIFSDNRIVPEPFQLRQPHAAPHGSPCHFPRPVAQRSRRPPDNADFVLFLF